MPNPAESAISRADEVMVGPYQQDVELQTPVTPVSAEGFISLQNLIIKQFAHALDDTSKQKLERHVLKSTKAGRMLFAKDVL
jgi:hypothetical protein